MRLVKRLLSFATPLHHYFPEYIIYTVFGIVFGLVNFAMLIPLLDTLFSSNAVTQTNHPGEFRVGLDYFKDLFSYYFHYFSQQKGKWYALAYVCSVIVLATILSNFFRYMAVRVLVRLRMVMLERIRLRLYDRFCDQSLSFYNKRKKGDMLTVITHDVQEIEHSVINAFQVFLRDPFMIIAYFIMLFYWSPSLTVFTIIFFPVSGFIISIISRSLKRKGYFNQEMLAKILQSVDQTISGIKIIQAFGARKFFQNRFADLNRSFSKSSKAMFNQKELASPLSELFGIAIIVTVVLYGGRLVIEGNLEGSVFITYLALYSQILQPAKNISTAVTSLQKGLVSVERVYNLIDTPIEIRNAENATRLQHFNSEVKFNNVSFSYNQEPVLRNIELTIPKGKMIALVGHSGSGKSTIGDLVPRFFDVQEGSITIDGQDIRSIKLDDLRKMIGIVTQEAIIFNDTVVANITMGLETDEQRLIQAADTANATEFIKGLENKFETTLGDRGSRLSGGQKQRLAIARAIYKNPPILILDEATSALDTESEKLVQDALDKLMQNRTSIVIAHRLSTVRHADTIIVLKQGEIVERGTHAELMERNGHYRRLVDMQEVK
ncbi:MAG TPA: ABC transporter ATP-binding protein [Chitinophagaceae bacterium]